MVYQRLCALCSVHSEVEFPRSLSLTATTAFHDLKHRLLMSDPRYSFPYLLLVHFSSTLGNCSNSPSALFIASDGESLRLYQAVIDARTILAEMGTTSHHQVGGGNIRT